MSRLKIGPIRRWWLLDVKEQELYVTAAELSPQFDPFSAACDSRTRG